jgi:hypothetical protein
MSEIIDRATEAMIEKWRIHAGPGDKPDVPFWRDMARAAIGAMRGFATEDFTLTEAAGIRRLIDEALDGQPPQHP